MADLFCGGGGTSAGAVQAFDSLGIRSQVTALNHWDIAVDTHKLNFPEHRARLADLDSANPREYFKEGELDLLWASPECTHHSRAAGGRPKNEQSRATAWCVVKWAEAIQPKVILVENVPEFMEWGPIGCDGKALKSKRGKVFLAWVMALESLGYRVSWRVLCAADYGDPTSRRRLFVQAVRGRRKVVWPEPTHGESDVFTKRIPYRTAREVIDWDVPAKSIFGRKKPLAEKTLYRIWDGFFKEGLKPFIVPQQRGGRSYKSVDEPLSPVTTRSGEGVAIPYLISIDHQGTPSGVKGLDVPLTTLTTKARHAMAIPYLVKFSREATYEPLDRPLTTVRTSGNHHGLAIPYLIRLANNQAGCPLDVPMSTVTTNIKHGVCIPYLVKFFGTATAKGIDEPLGTVTTKDRYGLVLPVVELAGDMYLLDILFRMLKPHELAAAQGFPVGYQFAGGTHANIVKQIGNAVPCGLAGALVRAVSEANFLGRVAA